MRENGRGHHSGAKILYGPLYTGEDNSMVVTDTEIPPGFSPTSTYSGISSDEKIGRGLHSEAKILYGPLYTREGNSKVVINTVWVNFRLLSNQYIFRYFQRWEKMEEGFRVAQKFCMVPYTLVKVIPRSSPTQSELTSGFSPTSIYSGISSDERNRKRASQ